MSGISRKQFGDAFANTAIDVNDEPLDAVVARTSVDLRKADARDGRTDGRVSGQGALDDLYDQVNRLDRLTSTLSSKRERAVWDALRGAAVAPAPISSEQGVALAAAARKMVADEGTAPGQTLGWALAGTAECVNPALSSPTYAGPNVWKCNVFVGEAFYRAGLPFPLNSQHHYVPADDLPAQTRFFQPVAKLADIRPGDVIAIHRDRDSGHLEIVTGVERGPSGEVVNIRSAGAHSGGSAEGDGTAIPLVAAAQTNGGLATVQDGSVIERVLRPMAPPPAVGTR
jgi:hypothetical protein